MPAYIVSFELKDDSRRESLLNGLKSYGGYCPINENCWAISTTKSAVQIRDHLTGLLGSGDRIFVIRSGTEAAWRKSYGQKNDDWLKEYL
jgi:hypothetical protein